MNTATIALTVGAAMALASTSVMGETIGSDIGPGGETVKSASTKNVRLAAVSRIKAIGKPRTNKVSATRSARRVKYLALARTMKPAGLPISLVDAVITMESGYNPTARGRHGEIGLMQIKPATARMVGSLTGVRAGKLSVPANNLRVGMAYLDWCYKRAKRSIPATIGCYNAGPGNMWNWQKFAVTRKYVRFVRRHIASRERAGADS